MIEFLIVCASFTLIVLWTAIYNSRFVQEKRKIKKYATAIYPNAIAVTFILIPISAIGMNGLDFISGFVAAMALLFLFPSSK